MHTQEITAAIESTIQAEVSEALEAEAQTEALEELTEAVETLTETLEESTAPEPETTLADSLELQALNRIQSTLETFGTTLAEVKTILDREANESELDEQLDLDSPLEIEIPIPETTIQEPEPETKRSWITSLLLG